MLPFRRRLPRLNLQIHQQWECLNHYPQLIVQSPILRVDYSPLIDDRQNKIEVEKLLIDPLHHND